ATGIAGRMEMTDVIDVVAYGSDDVSFHKPSYVFKAISFSFVIPFAFIRENFWRELALCQRPELELLTGGLEHETISLNSVLSNRKMLPHNCRCALLTRSRTT